LKHTGRDLLRNILLTTLGRGDLYETNYSFAGRKFSSSYCCLALCKLLEKKINLIKVLLTKEAKEKHKKSLEKEAEVNGIDLEIIDIPSGKTNKEIWLLFDQLTENFKKKQNANVFLDITNSFRHLPIMAFTSLVYLESIQNLNFAGIYYGAFEAKDKNNVTPVFDISPLYNIVKGTYGVKAFEESGSIIQLKDFLNEILDLQPGDQKTLNSNLENLDSYLASGFSIETGDYANKVYKWIEKKIPQNNFSYAAQDLLNRLKNRIENIKIDQKVKKESKELTFDELKRQLELIKWHIENRNTSKAVILLREWIVNRVWLAQNPQGNWLKVKDREQHIERRLGFLAFKSRNDKQFKSELKSFDLIKAWNSLIQARNQFAHAGFQTNNINLVSIQKSLKGILELCLEEFSNKTFWKLPHRKNNHIRFLITPMGASFGLLFTALKKCNPDKVCILTSEKFKGNALEACHKAGYKDENYIKVFIINDPFAGFNETPELIKQVWSEIKEAENILINLTGGTTAMQWAMQSLYEKIKDEQLPAERIAFVDRRSGTEQQSNPWVVGELIEVEKLIHKND
jgi:CRISPR-associated Csx2 family protein